MKIIYDFGSNNGDDIPYYLIKADSVVAVEASPLLCEGIKGRFAGEISSGRLIVENCVLSERRIQERVHFYIHKSNHVLSQYPRPSEASISDFEEISLPAKTAADIIQRHGAPHYIKIDIEHYDQHVLRSLFLNDIFSPFISAEAHSVEVFSLLVASGHYDCFKLVDGHSVSRKYRNARIVDKDGRPRTYAFPYHSAGPFGEDVEGDWLSADDFLAVLALEGLGWKDIHATNLAGTKVGRRPRIKNVLAMMRALSREARRMYPRGHER